MNRHFFLVAGEPSGDLLGAALIAGLKGELGGAVRFSGVGGPAMAAEGLESLIPQEDLAVMGLVEVLPRLRQLLRHISTTASACVTAAPDALVTIDSPSFGLRVMKRVRRAAPAIRTVHYVAPSVWAWRPGRAKRMVGLVDHLLALLPFEPPLFTAHGIGCTFVGHPVAARPRPDRGAIAAAGNALGLRPGQPVLLTLPGSRAGEVRRHMAPFAPVIVALQARHPDLAVVLPTVAGVADLVAEQAQTWPVTPIIADPTGRHGPALPSDAVFALGTAALAASGTVTLELAAAGVPMVAVYRTHPVTAAIVRRIVKVDTANLVNLIVGGRPVPEFLQEHFTTEAAVAAMAPLFTDEPARAVQCAAFRTVMEVLGRDGPPPGVRAARALIGTL